MKDGGTFNSVQVTITFTGTIRFWLCADGNTETWEEIIDLSSATVKTYSFNTTGTAIKWYALLSSDAVISQVKIKKVN